MSKNNEKTNVMRIFEQNKLSYIPHIYTDTDAVSGEEVAAVLNEDPNRTYKTLVCIGSSKNHYVFMVPVNRELHLKKAAQAVGEKSIEMIKSKELLPLTGYIHGGCSPVGMKKLFKTVIDKSSESFETIFFSAGKIGFQIETSLNNLSKIIPISTAFITE